MSKIALVTGGTNYNDVIKTMRTSMDSFRNVLY